MKLTRKLAGILLLTPAALMAGGNPAPEFPTASHTLPGWAIAVGIGVIGFLVIRRRTRSQK